MYTITEVTDRSALLIIHLLRVWERSVRATHLFLSSQEIEEIKAYVPHAMQSVAHLIIARNDAGAPVAFMGIQDQKLEMLFLDPDERGKGLGRELFQHGVKHFGVQEVTVNEQNQQALGFYEYMGFRVYERMDLDEQGKPYPIHKMRL